MSKMADGNSAVDARDTYTPPCVVKMTDLKQGAGDCTSGSGDTVCHNGNLATGFPGGCCTGNSATHDCVNGNSPSGGCHTGNIVFS
jgi:hypothetical protein